MLRGLIAKWANQIVKWANRPEFESNLSKVILSWADYCDSKKAKIVLYGIKSCPTCKEIKLWLESNWVPYIYVDCQQIFPVVIPKARHLLGYFGFIGNKRRLFLYRSFPQVDLISPDGKWERYMINTKDIRNRVEEFIQSNIKDFPGFENGVHGDVQPEEQAFIQLQTILEQKRENGRKKADIAADNLPKT